MGNPCSNEGTVRTDSMLEVTSRGCGAESSAYDTLSDENDRYDYDVRLHKARADTVDGFTGLPVVRTRPTLTCRHLTRWLGPVAVLGVPVGMQSHNNVSISLSPTGGVWGDRASGRGRRRRRARCSWTR